MQFPREVQNLIADLRGLPHDRSKAIENGAAKLDTLLEVILKQYKIGEKTPQQEIMENWRSIVGAGNAHRCSPARIVSNIKLVVRVSNPVLRQELQFQKRQILQRLHDLPTCKSLRDITFTAG